MGTCIVASFISPFAGSGESDCLVTERGEQCLVSMRFLNKIHHIAKLLAEENISVQEYGRIKYYFYLLSKLFMDENFSVAVLQIQNYSNYSKKKKKKLERNYVARNDPVIELSSVVDIKSI